MSAILRTRSYKMPEIERYLAEVLDMTRAELHSCSRTRFIVYNRQIVMLAIRDLTGNSYPAVGNYFGVDHSTVIHAITSVYQRMYSHPHLFLALFLPRVSEEELARRVYEAQCAVYAQWDPFYV